MLHTNAKGLILLASTRLGFEVSAFCFHCGVDGNLLCTSLFNDGKYIGVGRTHMPAAKTCIGNVRWQLSSAEHSQLSHPEESAQQKPGASYPFWTDFATKRAPWSNP